MSTLTMEFKYDEDNNKIMLYFSDTEEIKIDTSGDVDLSEYVKKLTYIIEEKKILSFEKIEVVDPKIILIQDTIYDIKDSYNESINLDSGSLEEID